MFGVFFHVNETFGSWIPHVDDDEFNNVLHSQNTASVTVILWLTHLAQSTP